VFLLLIAGVLAWAGLGLTAGGLLPSAGGARIAADFFGAALSPALSYEDAPPTGSSPLLATVAVAAYRTLIFAAAAMSLSLVFGLLFGFLAADTWWHNRPRWLRGVQWTVRVLIALLRSVHELLWAVLFLAAFGLNTGAAVLAISLPFTGTLAKVFSEMLDEAPHRGAEAIVELGGTSLQHFLFGLLPAAAPDMAAYAFYRFECAVRSAAILGFFGYETLGYFLRLSFDNLHFREVWTYLYAIVALVLLLEAWSGRLRRRFVAA
jgi:phosphonate transport system permease protein